MHPVILIPARMDSTRLPGKPLADIHGEPMIVHVWRRASAACIGPVVVACDDMRIKDAVEKVGGRAVMTRSDHPSGSDRIFEALGLIDPDRHYDVIVNVQGDVPTIEHETIRTILAPLQNPDVAIATLACEIKVAAERDDPSVVKPILSFPSPLAGEGQEGGGPGIMQIGIHTPHLNPPPQGGRTSREPVIARTLYFSRASIPHGDGPLYHHIGVYAYRRAALEKFVSLPPSPLELREKLEQLRALEAGMRIDVALVHGIPLGVDTAEQLDRARELLK